jgi:predicted phosphate transport protein (TIGR00153 family)
VSSGSLIGRLFGASPIKPMQQHMAKVSECVRELGPFFKAVADGDWQKAEQIQQRISHLENEADDLKKELRLHLPKGLMLPVSRGDLLEALVMQDRIANKAKDIAGLMLGRKMHLPKGMDEQFLRYVERSIEAALQAERAINELDELVETGFRGGEVELVEAMIKTLDEIESDNDALQVAIRATLFTKEQELPPIEVMFLYKIIEWIGDLADIAQRVGSRLQLMLAR